MLKRETCDELLRKMLGYDDVLPVTRTLLVTVLETLTLEAKADLIQHLQGAPPAKPEHGWGQSG